MNKNTVDRVNKATFILLLVFAAVAILAEMIAGPLDHKTISISASACACIIGVSLIVHTLRAFISKR